MSDPSLFILIVEARAEAFRRGIDLHGPDASEKIAAIVWERYVARWEEAAAAAEAEQERQRRAELERYYKRNPGMHPDNWVRVMFDSRRMVSYRKDSEPPPGVLEAIANGTARAIEPSPVAVPAKAPLAKPDQPFKTS